MYANLQRGVGTAYGWIPKWWAPNTGPLLSLNMWYAILGHFEESAKEPTVWFSRQPATQSTGSSDSHFKEADSSSESTEAPADFDTVFSH